MSLPYAYTPLIWPSVMIVLLVIMLAVYAWRRRSVPGALPFMVGCLFGAAWAAGSVMEYATLDLATKTAWFKFEVVCQPPIVTAITCFFLEYAWPGRWLTRRNLILLSIPCFISLISVYTNDLHHLSWLGLAYDGRVIWQPGTVTWIIIVYAFVGLGILNLIVFAWLFQRSPQHRLPVVLMLIGQIVGRTIYALDSARMIPSILPITILGMAFEFLVYAVALFGFRILDPIPHARQTAIEQLQAGMLVLDPLGNVVSLNPAARAILAKPEKQLIGHSIQDLLPSFPGDLLTAGKSQVEMSLPGEHRDDVGTGPESRAYHLEASALNDWRGLAVGRLLMLQDVTEQRQSQAQILEQQRALAILTERERLARELHDDLGQVLAFISTQGQVIQQLLVGGEVTKAGSYVARLIEAADEADVDIRESILSLRAPFNGQGLIPALQDYLRRYEQRYGLHIQILLPEHGLGGILEPVTEVQILRILQEALTNARKHANAHRMQITFASLDGHIQIAIQDDGQGFDPGNLHETARGGFGLQFMRERVEAIGGSLEIQTAPGQGTEITLIVPMRESYA